ncbi:MAG: hypothetical protein ACJA1R_000579 [Flavobacteriales bacterium]|jgi:hypothetical protein
MVDNDKLEEARRRLAMASMSSERPLDALLSGLAQPAGGPLPQTAVHPRVLQVEVDGQREWGIIVWSDPGGAQKLHTALLGVLEAALLAELSRPPKSIHEDGAPKFAAVTVFVFAETEYEIAPAVRAFGLQPVDYVAEDYAERMRAIADEARMSGRSTPERPASVWRAEVSHHEGALGEKLDGIQSMMAERMGDDVWGETPGGPSKLFADYVDKAFGEAVKPNVAGVQALEMLLVQRTVGKIRWMPPLLFQALCDFIPIVAQVEFGAKTSWAVCEALEGGFAQPPLIRFDNGPDGPTHVPLGPHVLRWCMMPLHEGERVDPLADWVVDQFKEHA